VGWRRRDQYPNDEGIVPGVGTDINEDQVESGALNSVTEEITTAGFQSLINVIDGLDPETGAALDSDTPKTGIALVSEMRSYLGAVQNRLEHTVSNVDTVAENMQSAESRVRDVDMAKEMMAFTKNNILNQAATAMLAQANQAPQTVLSLIR